MTAKKRKIIRNTLIVVFALVVGAFAVNWYLKYRLESFLKDMLNEKVSEATHGFYNLTFEHLSIGLFSGELLLEGIRFVPDSIEFQKLSSQELLPEDYFRVNVGSIYFKGVNLTWHRDYKRLFFKLFEVKDADVEIYSAKQQSYTNTDSAIKSMSVYDIISPFIDVLSVERINLENSSVKYFTNDGTSPASYGLKNINFSAYSFLLNKDSEQFGKLLYSDNFNFESQGEQTLLENAQFRLKTQQIRFDTRDSIIQIQNVELIPQKDLWKKINKTPDSYIDGIIKSVEIRGINFRRDSAVNRLNAESFNINTPYIEYISIANSKAPQLSKTQGNVADSLNFSWSLYSILSPVLNKVEIKEVGVNNAKMKYQEVTGKDTNVYMLDDFKLKAINFLVDSISDTAEKHKFLYSDNFGILARGIDGVNFDKNYHFSLNKMVLSTLDKRLRLENIAIKPISTQTKNDYIIADIESIDIDSLYYNLGLEAGSLQVNNPKIEYVKAPLMYRRYSHREDSVKQTKQEKGTNVWNQISSLLNHLSINKIDLKGGDIVFRDNEVGSIYELADLNFFAEQVFVDQNTINTSQYLHAVNDFGLDFTSFRSVLNRGLYRIRTDAGKYTRNKGDLQIKNISLVPLAAPKRLDKYYKASIPLLELKGIKAVVDKNTKEFDFKALRVLSPQIDIVINKNTTRKQSEDRKTVSEFFFDRLSLHNLLVSDALLNTVDRLNEDTTNLKIKSIDIDKVDWSKNSIFTLGSLRIADPVFISVANEKNRKEVAGNNLSQNTNTLSLNSLVKGILISDLSINNLKTEIKTPSMSIKSSLPKFLITNLNWNPELLSVGQINVGNINGKIVKSVNLLVLSDTLIDKKSDSDIYDNLKRIANRLSVKNMRIDDANLDYSYEAENTPKKYQRFSETNLELTGLEINNLQKKTRLKDIYLAVNKFSYPLDNGFYTLSIDKILMDSKKSILNLDSITLLAAYPKEVFAYKQPHHKDWFNVNVNTVRLQGLNYRKFIEENQLDIDTVSVGDVLLQNYKNQKIPIEHRPMPMLYAGLQNAPVEIKTQVIDVKNFNVIYEELPKKGDVASKIFFTKMNGYIDGLTNMPSYPDQMYLLKADGYLMGSGYFKANWYLPVSKNYDCFVLDAKLDKFDLRELNQLVSPMAPVRIDSGWVKKVVFDTEGNSLGASIDLLMLYNDLRLTIQKSSDNENPNKFFTTVVNKVLKSSNPKKPTAKPRKVHADIIRDPNHSTFNYIWQILQPPVAESVGVSQGSQRFIKRVSVFVSKVKSLFGKGDKKTKNEPLPVDVEENEKDK